MEKLIAMLILCSLLIFVLTFSHIYFVSKIVKDYKNDWRVTKGKTIFYSSCIILCNIVEVGLVIYSFVIPAIVEVL